MKIPELVFVKGGTFTIGCLEERDGSPRSKWEQPTCEVTLSDFWIGKYPVTNEEFATFLNDYGSNKILDDTFSFQGETMIYESRKGIKKALWKKEWYAQPGYERHPVTRVTWFGAHEYCLWLQKNQDIQDGNFHLPLEVQWEYAARGGNESKNFPFSGSKDINEVGWFDQNSRGSFHQEVGQKNQMNWEFLI